MMKLITQKRISLLLVLAILLLNVGTAGSVLGKETKSIQSTMGSSSNSLFFDRIVIITSGQGEVTTTLSETLYNIMLKTYGNVELISVSTPSEVRSQVTNDDWLIIWALDTDLQGVYFSGHRLRYKSFVNLVTSLPQEQVFAMGNSRSLSKYLPDAANLHVMDDKTDNVDALVVSVYAIWEISELLAQRGGYYEIAGDKMKSIAVQVFAQKFDALFERLVEPKEEMGQRDDAALKRWYDNYTDPRYGAVNYVSPDGSVTVPLAQAIHERMFDPNMYALVPSLKDDSLGGVLVGFIPEKSGLDGPVGGIVDLFLDVVRVLAGSVNIELPPNVANTISNITMYIPKLLGLIEDPSVDNLLEVGFDIIKTQFPDIAKYENYTKLVIQGIKVFTSGDTSAMFSFLKTLLGMILPSSVTDIVNYAFIAFDHVSTLIDEVKNAKNPMDKLVEVLMTELTSGMLNSFLNSTFGIDLSNNQVIKQVNTTIALIKTTIQYFTTKNYWGFLTEQLPQLFAAISPYLPTTVMAHQAESVSTELALYGEVPGLYTAVSASDLDGIITMLETVFWGFAKNGKLPNAKDFLENAQINTIIKNLITKALTTAGVATSSAQNVATQVSDILKDVLKGTFNAVSTLKTQIQNVMNQLTGLSNDVKSFLQDTIYLVIAQIAPDLKAISTKGLKDLIPQAVNYLMSSAFGSSVKQEIQDILTYLIQTLMSIQAFISDTKEYINALVSDAETYIENIKTHPEKLIEPLLEYGLKQLNSTAYAKYYDTIKSVSTFIITAIKSVTQGSASWGGILRGMALWGMQTLTDYLINELESSLNMKLKDSLKPFIDAAIGMFESIIEEPKSVLNIKFEVPSLDEILSILSNNIFPLLTAAGLDANLVQNIQLAFKFIVNLKGFFENGISWLIGQLKQWVAGLVADLIGDLVDELSQAIGNFKFFNLSGEFTIGIGGQMGFTVTYLLQLIPNISLDSEGLKQFILDLVFNGAQTFKLSDIGSIFLDLFKFLQISPSFKAGLEVGGLGSGDPPIFTMILSSLGLEIEFSGSIFFNILLFSLGADGFDFSNFLKVLEWGFTIEIRITKEFTILDFLTGGVGGGALNKLASYIGLDGLKIILTIGILFSIVKRAASPTQPESGTLTFQLTVSAILHLGIDIIIASLTLDVGFEIVLTFTQDLLNTSKPLEIILDIYFILKVKIGFLFSDIKFGGEYKIASFNLSPSSTTDPDTKDNAMGYDSDGDGIPDSDEALRPGLDPNAVDTDKDGLSDKAEIQYSKTDPTIPDTDGDGLDDNLEYNMLHTNPLEPDSDYDGLNDHEEAIILGTNPLAADTDGDGLSDYYEVNTALNMTGITPSVTSVKIGQQEYTDHTDPLNPDTDGDGLLDGQEGTFGPWYGNPDNFDSSSGQPLILFNNGYTHPLDNDTDDDSYLQYVNGSITGKRVFLRDMTDKVEIDGIGADTIVDGEFVHKIFRTNPTAPDTDQDSSYATETNLMNSDGYELSLDPATDPLDADTDDDGLIDGLEGFVNYGTAGTNPFDPDTDNDGLADLLDISLGTNPRDVDSDHDGVTDGDEYFIYGTNPMYADTDFDGVNDGDELYLFHSNPYSPDSDGDGINDYDEIFTYGSDPMDDDSDNDNLTDFQEIAQYHTDPFNMDTDGDGLRDGEEVQIYRTDPLNPDTDGDGILYPNENGEPTFPWTDGMEVAYAKTSPLKGDTDNDGILDSMELYLGSGLIPNFTPIALDPASNDTDGDGLYDNQEIVIMNMTDIIYPYVSFPIIFPYNSSPVLADTDGDGLTDFIEINNTLTLPSVVDTDHDQLSDYDEYMFFGTDPRTADTDGDGLLDSQEQLYDTRTNSWVWAPLNVTQLNETYSIVTDPDTNATQFLTYANDSDTDNDFLPDGAEIALYGEYGLDPLNPDQNNDGIPDGLNLDSDNDLLTDGEEWFIYNTTRVASLFNKNITKARGADFLEKIKNSGGAFNPDSDRDGLLDGGEVYAYGTDPVLWDTDNDTYGDGFEVMVGTNPLLFTNASTMNEILKRLTSPVLIVSPQNNAVYGKGEIPVQVMNMTLVDSVWYRYKLDDGTWSENITLTFNDNTRPGMWEDTSAEWNDEGVYTIQAFGRTPNGTVIMDEITFEISGTSLVNNPYVIGGGVAAIALAGASGTTVFLRKRA